MVRYIHKQRKNKNGFTLKIDTNGQLAVITNYRVTKSQVEDIVIGNMEWIATARKKQSIRAKEIARNLEDLNLSEDVILQAKNKAKTFLANRCRVLAIRFELFDLLNSMDIKSYKSKWGTCDNRGNLTLNWRLMLLPKELRDYVIIHELSHLKEMNHSKRFWKVVESFCKDYSILRKTLNREYVSLMSIQ